MEEKREKTGGKKEEKTDENSGHYVIASSRPPEHWNAARSCQKPICGFILQSKTKQAPHINGVNNCASVLF